MEAATVFCKVLRKFWLLTGMANVVVVVKWLVDDVQQSRSYELESYRGNIVLHIAVDVMGPF